MGGFLITMGVSFGLLTSLPPVPHRFLSALCVLAFLVFQALAIRKEKRFSKAQLLQAVIFLVFLLYVLLRREVSVVYYLLAKISGGFCALVGALIGKPISMGLTYSGMDLIVFFAIALLFATLFYNRKAWKQSLLAFASMLLLWGVYVGLWTVLAERSHALRLDRIEPLTGALDFRLLLFCLLSAVFLFVCRRLKRADAAAIQSAKPSKSAEPPKPAPHAKAAMLTPAVLLLLSAVLLVFSAVSSRAPAQQADRQVLFLDTGIDWNVPTRAQYGLDYAGMFGVLPHYLRQNGYRCKTVSELDDKTLAESDVLVVFNPMRFLSETELAAVLRFVENGGSLLAVGDHTGDAQVRLPLNDMLEPAGISLNFDSAVPFKSLWAEEYERHASPVFAGASGRNVQMVVGASLDAGPFAKPLVIGKEGFSDFGNLENTDGYLGDMRFSRGERIGDLILAAEGAYGKGKIMAFGDTTPFQNTVIPYSYPFLDNVFAYLCDTGRVSVSHSVVDSFFAASCVVDASHTEVFGRDKSGDAADGLLACAMRAGFMPYLNQNESLLSLLETRADIKLVVLIAPAAAFSKAELDGLEAFMENGGTVILSAGYESPAASQALAAHFGFSFDPMPIGRIVPESHPEMAFWNACPVLYNGAFPDHAADGISSLVDIWGYCTIAHRAVGSGGLYVFGDPDFLKNKNLESVETYRKGNVEFLDALLTALLEGRR